MTKKPLPLPKDEYERLRALLVWHRSRRPGFRASDILDRETDLRLIASELYYDRPSIRAKFAQQRRAEEELRSSQHDAVSVATHPGQLLKIFHDPTTLPDIRRQILLSAQAPGGLSSEVLATSQDPVECTLAIADPRTSEAVLANAARTHKHPDIRAYAAEVLAKRPNGR